MQTLRKIWSFYLAAMSDPAVSARLLKNAIIFSIRIIMVTVIWFDSLSIAKSELYKDDARVGLKLAAMDDDQLKEA